MALTKQIEKVQGQALGTLADSQKRVLGLNEKVADVVKDRVAGVKLPFASMLPTPTEGVKLYFDFAGKVMAHNRKFAETLVKAWAPEAKTAPGAKLAPKVRKAA